MKMHSLRLFLPISLVMTLLASCSSTKYVGEGDLLLNKTSVKTDGKYPDISTSQLQTYLKQKGNSRWFSAFKAPLAIYSLSGRDSTKWINKALRKMGEAPEIYDSALANRTSSDMADALKSMGYMGASVSIDTTLRKKGKAVDVAYVAHPGKQYRIESVSYQVRDSAIASLLCVDDTLKWGIKAGSNFSVAALDAERKRITSLLQANGYYRFNKDYISYLADTIAGSQDIRLTLILRQYRLTRDSVGPHPQYMVRNITYSSGDQGDSTIHLKQSILLANTFIKENSMFSSTDLQRTYNRFGRMGAVKYTNISFSETEDSLTLDCNIQVSTNKPHTISFQPEGTNTAGDLGAAASLTYAHRNLFRGSEQLSIEFRGAYEAIEGLEGYNNNDFFEFSVETSLTFPRFIAPFVSKRYARHINATSEVSLLYDTQNRPEYHRRVLSLAWRYKWATTGHHDKYQLDLIDLSYVFMPWISDTFREEYLEDDESRNAILRYNYEDLFIMKLGFGYSYNNEKIAIKANIETAGNLLSLIDNIAHFDKNDDGQSMFFKIAFAQYVKGDFDLTRNIDVGYGNQLALHFGLGIAYPYGNSDILPFEKRYFSGGANSVRGWSVRELGPGKFARSDGKIDFINQTGDIKLDINVEYRTKLFWKFNGALFVDAGNIWTIRDYEDQPGGQFAFDTFWEQIAVAYGFGLRLNFDYFLLRFDFGMKAVNPSYTSDGGEHYPLVNPDIGRDLTFHFAVGLPF